MKSIETAKKLEGLHTLETAAKALNVKKSTAVKMMSILRKEGFVETSGGGKKPRLYKISPLRIAGKEHLGLYDVINKYSKVKLWEPYKHKIMDRDLSVEEAIPMAVKEGETNFRLALAALGLFNHVKDWPKFCQYTKKYNVARRAGALYDVARTIMKIKRMDKRTRNALLKGKDKSRFIVKPHKPEYYKDIEKTWRVYIPFHASDLTRYKE
jgi:hypothetical protein